MRDHLDLREAVVDPRLEDLHAPPRDLSAREAADQLFGLPGEHRAADHFEGAGAGWVHFLSLLLLLFLDSHFRTDVRERAALALRAARRADAPAVLDERVADPGPAFLRDDPVEIALGLHRVRLTRPAEAPREAPDVRIHDDPVRRSPDVSKD